ncbi:MAG: CopG family transcriptional regulator [Leptospiraceae bacterium]|nr:CopG family transcriptional regulator [Leptospiraceae bacterium]MCP5494347.1 CopG family transcriptional regulator [Leptospiraceae bacterium]
MAQSEKRFQLLLKEEELVLLKKEAEKRGVSASELLRLSLKNELSGKSSYSKVKALHKLANDFADD